MTAGATPYLFLSCSLMRTCQAHIVNYTVKYTPVPQSSISSSLVLLVLTPLDNKTPVWHTHPTDPQSVLPCHILKITRSYISLRESKGIVVAMRDESFIMQIDSSVPEAAFTIIRWLESFQRPTEKKPAGTRFSGTAEGLPRGLVPSITVNRALLKKSFGVRLHK